jgi:hypothetical protein
MPRYPVKMPLNSSSEAGGVAAVDRALSLLSAFGPATASSRSPRFRSAPTS